MSKRALLGLFVALFASLAPAAANAQSFAKVDEIFADYALDNHIPGLVYGIVSNGKLIHVRGIGVQDLESKRPVTADTLFRIASMTKAFTALTVLKLRDEGKLQLDAPAETYVPEMRGWKYPTQDSPRIRVRDLLNHTAGFVTDDPWGDRQTPHGRSRVHEAVTRRRAVHASAGHRLGVLEPRLRAARPHHHERLRPSVCGHHHADTVEAARHDLIRILRRRRAARTPRARLSMGGRRVAARADDGARRVRRHGRHPDQRQRLRQVGRLSTVGMAAAR